MHCKIDDPYTYYNWQFLRRNPEYRADFDSYASLLKTDETEAQTMLLHLYKRWGMSGFEDWRIEAPELLPNLFFDPVSCFGLFNYRELTSSGNPIEDIKTIEPGDQHKKRFLLLALDLGRLRSKEYKNFWNVVARVQAEHELKTRTGAERFNSGRKHLDVVLATYDFREQNPTATSYEIAQSLLNLYANEKSNPSQHTKKVEENLKRAKELIALAPHIPFDFSSQSQSN